MSDAVAGARKPAARTSTQLPHAPTSAALARRFVAATLHRWGLTALVEVVVLLADELVTNAIVHTQSITIGLVVSLGDHAVRVEVHDASRQLPTPDRLAAWNHEGGRGLGLVAALATSWGAEVTEIGDGKTVWFEVHNA